MTALVNAFDTVPPCDARGKEEMSLIVGLSFGRKKNVKKDAVEFGQVLVHTMAPIILCSFSFCRVGNPDVHTVTPDNVVALTGPSIRGLFFDFRFLHHIT